MSFDRWHSANPDAVGNGDNSEPPEPGTYDVMLVDGGAFTSKEKGEDWVKLTWRINGNTSDDDWTVLLGFRSQSAANFTKREVRELGVDVDSVSSMSDLDEAIKQLAGGYYEVQVVQNGEFRNTYCRGRAGEFVPADVPLDEEAFAPQQRSSAYADTEVPF